MNIALVFASTANVTLGFYLSSMAMGAVSDPRITKVIPAKTAYIDDSRNIYSSQFMAGDEEWALNVDTDIVWSNDMPGRLVDFAVSEGPGVYAGLYLTQLPRVHGDGSVTVEVGPCWRDTDDNWYESTPSPDEPGRELGVCGMGFTLVHREVLEALWDENAADDVDWWAFGRDQIAGRRSGEDVCFCTRARALGYKVWGVPSVRVGHEKATLLVP